MGETISGERQRNNSSHSLSHKAVDIQPQAPALIEEGNKGKEFKHQVSTKYTRRDKEEKIQVALATADQAQSED